MLLLQIFIVRKSTINYCTYFFASFVDNKVVQLCWICLPYCTYRLAQNKHIWEVQFKPYSCGELVGHPRRSYRPTLWRAVIMLEFVFCSFFPYSHLPFFLRKTIIAFSHVRNYWYRRCGRRNSRNNYPMNGRKNKYTTT